MNSWHQLLLWNMSQGRYLKLGKRPPFWGLDFDWTFLWMLAQDLDQARVSE